MEKEFVSVYKAMDEPTANIIKGALEDAGIPAVVSMKYGTHCLDGVIAMAEGNWGDVLVEEKDAEEARRVLREYADSDGRIDVQED